EGVVMHTAERNGCELAVGGRVELDRKPPSFRIARCSLHGCAPFLDEGDLLRTRPRRQPQLLVRPPHPSAPTKAATAFSTEPSKKVSTRCRSADLRAAWRLRPACRHSDSRRLSTETIRGSGSASQVPALQPNS